MLMLYAILVASASISTISEASAIKGHARPHEELGRSIKLAPAPAPILESSKRIYNDESIRRLAAAQPEAVKQIEQVAPAAPVSPIHTVEPTRVFESIAKDSKVAPLAELAGRSEEVKAAEQIKKDAVAADPAPVVVEPKSAPLLLVEPEAKKTVEMVEAPIKAEIPAVVEPKSAPLQLAEPEAKKTVEIAEAPFKAEVPAVVEQKSAPMASGELEAKQGRPCPNWAGCPGLKAEEANKVNAPMEKEVAPVVAAPAPEVEVKSLPQQSASQELKSCEMSGACKKVKEEAPAAANVPAEPIHIEVPAPDPGLVLSEPIDSTTKLLIDLAEHVQKFLPAEEQQQPAQPAKDQVLVAGVDYLPPAAAAPASSSSPVDPTGKSSGPLVPYSSVEEPIVPPLPSLEGVEKASAASTAVVAAAAPSQPASSSSSSSSVSSVSSSSSASSPSATRQGGQNQNQQQVITQLLDQLDTLQNRIQDTINQLVARRRYVMSALLRPMGTYVRRVRTNLERLQNRVNQLQAAAVSVGGGQNRPGGFVDAAAIETIRRRIDDISKRISDIVNRIRFSLTPTSAPLNSNGRK